VRLGPTLAGQQLGDFGETSGRRGGCSAGGGAALAIRQTNTPLTLPQVDQARTDFVNQKRARSSCMPGSPACRREPTWRAPRSGSCAAGPTNELATAVKVIGGWRSRLSSLVW
jgi:hypothetical protein